MKRKYLWRYPLRPTLDRLILNVTLSLLFCGPFIVISGFGVSYNVQILVTDGFRWWPIVRLAVFAPVLTLMALLVVVPAVRFLLGLTRKTIPVSLRAYPRGCPMAIPDPRDPMNHYGAYLARYCRDLDDLADEIGVTPLYDLGLRQAAGNQSIWFPTDIGIQTVNRLLENVAREECRIVDREAVRNDLEMLRAVLEEHREFHLMVV